MGSAGMVIHNVWWILRVILLVGGLGAFYGAAHPPSNSNDEMVSSIVFVFVMAVILVSFPRLLEFMNCYHNPINIWEETLVPLPKNTVSVFHALTLHGASSGICAGIHQSVAFGAISAEEAAQTIICVFYLVARRLFWRKTPASGGGVSGQIDEKQPLSTAAPE